MDAVNNMNSGFSQDISYSTASLLVLAADKPLSIKQVQSGRPLLLGRPTKDSHPDVAIESKICGRRHAQLSCVNGQWVYTDLGSINGSYVNGALYKSEAGQAPAQVTLNSGDVIRIDTTDLAHPDVDNGVWILFTIDQKRGGWFQKELNKTEEVTIGRVSDNVISLNSAFITRHHAKVTWNGTGYVLQDLGSRAGTWYNGNELTGPVVLKNRDTFCICDRTFVFLNDKLFFSNYESSAPAPAASAPANGVAGSAAIAVTGSAAAAAAVASMTAPTTAPVVQPGAPVAQPAAQQPSAPVAQPAAQAVQPSAPVAKPAVAPAAQPAVAPAVVPAAQPAVAPAVVPTAQPAVAPSVVQVAQPAAPVALHTAPQPNPQPLRQAPQVQNAQVQNTPAQANPQAVAQQPRQAVPAQPQMQPGYAAQPQAQPGYAAQPGYPVQQQARPGYPVQPQVQPGYAAQPQAQPGYPVQQQARPGYPAQPQMQPGYAAQPQAQPGYPAQQAQPQMQRNYLIQADIQSKKVKNTHGPGEVELLKNIRLNIEEGSLIALLGTAGAGKTTLMDILNASHPDGVTGRVTMDGQDLIANAKRLKDTIGIVTQDTVFYPSLTVLEQINQSAEFYLYDYTRKERKEAVDTLIGKFGMTPKQKSLIANCSGGEKRRVHIMMTMISDRRVFFMDEPDAGLDPGNKKNMFSILQNMAHDKENPKTILVIIHDVSELDMFDQVIMLRKFNNVGRLSFAGSPQEAKQYYGIKEYQQMYEKINQDVDGSKYLMGGN